MITVCIAGKNDIACRICCEVYKMFADNDDISVVASLTGGDDGKNGWQRSYKAFCEEKGIKILSLEELYEVDNLFFFSTEYDRIVKPEKFRNAKLFNIHFSLLPAYKGILPSVLPIINGETKTGVTLHVMRSGIDTGEIIAQKECEIADEDFAIDLYSKLSMLGADLVIQWLPHIIDGDYSFTPQSAKGSSYYGRGIVDYGNLSLNVNATAFQIRNQVRGFSFRPFQMLSWNDLNIIDCRISDIVSTEKPGTILTESDTEITISTIDYDVTLYKDNLDDFLSAIASGDNERAKRLCACSRMVNERESKHGWTPLIVATYNNNREMVEYLIARGADIHIKNYEGTNLLMYAKDCYFNSKDAYIFKLFAGKGLSVHEQDYSGKSLLDYLSDEQRSEIEKIM